MLLAVRLVPRNIVLLQLLEGMDISKPSLQHYMTCDLQITPDLWTIHGHLLLCLCQSHARKEMLCSVKTHNRVSSLQQLGLIPGQTLVSCCRLRITHGSPTAPHPTDILPLPKQSELMNSFGKASTYDTHFKHNGNFFPLFLWVLHRPRSKTPIFFFCYTRQSTQHQHLLQNLHLHLWHLWRWL